MSVIRSKAHSLAGYIKRYVEAYRAEWERFTASPPAGAGYPELRVSAYLEGGDLHCLIARDGVAIVRYTPEPHPNWFIAGGPAMMVDTEPSSVPVAIEALRAQARALAANEGGSIGIYRLARGSDLDLQTFRGVLPPPIATAAAQAAEGDVTIHAQELDLDLATLIARLTFGAFGPILDLHLPSPDGPFWNPTIVRDLGFMSADPQYRRFMHYLELLPHTEDSAWDPRNLWARVHVDLRRDFASASTGQPLGGYLAFSGADPRAQLTDHLSDRLQSLDSAIAGFEQLLNEHPEGVESLFQDFLEQHAVLLDVYGEIQARPRFYYPREESPLGKTYVEPDFLVRHPGNRYRLIELERPGKQFGTQQGQAAAALTQAAFQVAEWISYIQNHYDLLKERYPGISSSCRTTVIMSRATERQLGGSRNVRALIQLYGNQLAVDEILLYDDLIARAREASYRLAAHAVGSLAAGDG